MSAIVVTPRIEELVLSDHDLWIHELVNGSLTGNAPGAPASVAWVVLGPRQSTKTHRHDESWTYVTVLKCGAPGAITQAGADMSQVYVQRFGQVLVIPPGVEHRARNRSKWRWLVAIEIRTCASVFDDRILLPHLDHVEVPSGKPPNRSCCRARLGWGRPTGRPRLLGRRLNRHGR